MALSGDAGAGPLAELAARYGLRERAVGALGCLLGRLVCDPVAPTAVRDPVRAVNDHLADSLVALELPEVARAGRVVDIGAGAGLPGLPLAIARETARFVLLESAARKCAFLSEVVHQCGLANVSIVHARAEGWPEGLVSFDVAAARALAPLPVVLEYAAPLLRLGGAVVAWRGRRDSEAEEAGERAARELGLELVEVRSVRPYRSASHRHLHLWSKVRETPDQFPRRPGMALKRPLGSRASASDRGRR
jgi:16S rRNA (guanine527-N7)-methyltransferase